MLQEKYKILDNMIEGVQIISPDFRYLYVNKTVTDHGKLSKEALIGFTMMEKYPGIEHSQVFKTIQQCMETGESHNLINEFDFPDGSKGYFELRMQRIDEGVLIFSYDVTDQKKAEEVIKRSNVELEEMVKQRTLELDAQNEIIRKQVLHLEELNDTKNKFFGIMAHDLRTPINTIRAFSELLIDHIERLDQQKIAELSRDLQSKIDVTLKMADNLIQWSKLQMNMIQSNPGPVNVKVVVDEIFMFYKEVARIKEIDLTSAVSDEFAVIADSEQLTFILRNLIGNSIKFTKPKGHIKLNAAAQSNNKISITVEDDGVGIPEKMLDKIFSIRGNSSTPGTQGEKGTGLGLLLCHEFTQLNDGEIDVKSKRGEGTTFTLLFNAPVLQAN